ncbi:MAG: DUF4115 domain-containing protein [Desulfoferrobacter sp.]
MFWIVENSKKVAVSQQKVVSEKASSAEERASGKPLVTTTPLPIQNEHTTATASDSVNRSEAAGQSEQQAAAPQVKEEMPPQVRESQQRRDLKSQNTTNELDLFIKGAANKEKRMLSGRSEEKASSTEERAPGKPLVSSPPLTIQKEHTSPAVNGSVNRSEAAGQSEQQAAAPQVKEEVPPQVHESQQRKDLKSQNTTNELDLFINGADFKEKRMLSIKRKEKAGPHTLNVKAIAECWIQFKIDGGKRRSELLHPGESRSWEVSKDAQLTIGNAGGIVIEWDGKTLGPGKSGRVLRINLPKELSQSNAKDQKLGR